MKKIEAAGGLVINENNEFLCIFRRGKWDLPKGKIDGGETPEIASIREVKEETGILHLSINDYICETSHTYYDHYFKEEVLKIIYWYKMYALSTEILIPQLSEDIEKIQWISLHNISLISHNTYPSIIHVLQQFNKLN